jgi:hypothetical protein
LFGVEINAPGCFQLDMRLTADELTAYFVRSCGQGFPSFRLFTAHRSSVTADFDSASPMGMWDSPDAGGGGSDQCPSVTDDELTLFFEQIAGPPPLSTTLWRSQRASVDDEFAAPVAVLIDGNSQPEAYGGSPYVISSGSRVYFNWVSPQGGLGYADSTDQGASFGAPNMVPLEVGDDAGTFAGSPVVTADELTVFSGRSDAPGIWEASRSDRTSAFAGAHALTELTSDLGNEQASWVSPDNCRLYFERGLTQIYVAQRL